MVSVLMPAFKAKFLSEAIQSVLCQTYRDFELIIVNDKSPEDITSIVNSFHDSRIRYYINDENLGSKDIVANWNRCLSYATGEYFCLICDDDLYESTFIEEMVSLAEKFPMVNVFRSGVKQINKQGEVYSYYPSSPEWESCQDYMWHVFSGFRCQTITEWFYRRQPIVDLGGYVSLPLAWYSDFLSIFIFSEKGGIGSSSKRLATFRMSGENITSQDGRNAQLKMNASLMFEQRINAIINSSKSEDREILKPLLRNYLKNKRSYSILKCSVRDFYSFFLMRDELQLSVSSFVKALIFRIIK